MLELDATVGWIIAAIFAVVSVVAILWRKDNKKEPAPAHDPVVAELRSKIEQQNYRIRELNDLIVNYPDVVKSLAGAINAAQVTAASSRGISGLMEAQYIMIFRVVNRRRLQLVDGVGFDGELRGSLTCSIRRSGLIPVIDYRGVTDLKDVPQAYNFFKKHGHDVRLAVPLMYDDRLLGMLAVGRIKMDQISAERTLAMIASLTSVSLHAAGVIKQIKRDAEVDELTQLANRRFLMNQVKKELERSRSMHAKFSIAMVDVDHFKNYNDTNGHVHGDLALKNIATIMSENTRAGDLVARYGGEEFSVLFIAADRQQSINSCQRIREAIEKSAFHGGATQPLGKVSVSMGVSTFPDDAASVDEMFRAADQALYQAKEEGRNRVITYEQSVINGHGFDDGRITLA